MNHPGDDELVLFHYKEEPGQARVAAHLAACAACQQRLTALERTMAAVDAHQAPEPGPEYEALVWSRIEPRLERSRAASRLSWFVPRRLALAGAVAILVIAAFVAGRYSKSPVGSRDVTRSSNAGLSVPEEPGGDAVSDGVLIVEAGDHLERSEMVLVELMNGPEKGRIDMAGAQEWARDLVPANRLVRQSATQAGEQGLVDLLSDLERLLIEISNGPSQLSSVEVQRIRDRVEAEGLIFRIRVLDSQLRQRVRAPVDGRSSS